MATSFFNGSFFDGEFFSVSTGGKTGVGGIDPGEGLKRRYPPVKPTGILHLPKKGRQARVVEERVEEAFRDKAEIAARLAREFGEETQAIPEFRPISTMTMMEVEAEIGVLLRKKLRNEEDEILLLMLMAAASS